MVHINTKILISFIMNRLIKEKIMTKETAETLVNVLGSIGGIYAITSFVLTIMKMVKK